MEKRVNFRNYCISLMWTSSCEHEQKLDYIFKVFDVNRDDAIDNEEFILMVSTPPDNNPHTFCVVLIV